ncbi:hypothetical protein GWI33_009712, partial [Rhynchophorus ferrugineus]
GKSSQNLDRIRLEIRIILLLVKDLAFSLVLERKQKQSWKATEFRLRSYI